ncbi:hypothetical protein ACFXKK_26665 [Streptomyces globisporus]|uniref:hypothetical protein n=1 Tax=Streptomyces globisporus TaxID=1908 RepID=UPI003665CD35
MSGGILRRAPHRRAQPVPGDQLAQFQPCVGLVVRGPLRQVGAGRDQSIPEVGHIQVAEGLREELLNQGAALVGRHAGSAGHEGESFMGRTVGDGAQDGLVGAEPADLFLQCLDVSGGHVGKAVLAVEGGADLAEPHAQLP